MQTSLSLPPPLSHCSLFYFSPHSSKFLSLHPSFCLIRLSASFLYTFLCLLYHLCLLHSLSLSLALSRSLSLLSSLRAVIHPLPPQSSVHPWVWTARRQEPLSSCAAAPQQVHTHTHSHRYNTCIFMPSLSVNLTAGLPSGFWHLLEMHKSAHP